MAFLFFKERHPKNKKDQHLIPFLQPIEINKFLTKHDTLSKRLKLAYSDTGSWDSKILPCIRQLALLCGHLSYSANGVFFAVKMGYSKEVFKQLPTLWKLWKARNSLKRTSWRSTSYKEG